MFGNGPQWLSPSLLYLGLLCLAVLLLGIHIQHGSILRPIRQKLLYRLLLASIAGWLGTWFLLPFGWFSIPDKTSSFFVPGTILGVLVMLPMLDHPERHLLRAAVLVWAATVAHAAIWFTGFSVFDVLETYDLLPPAPDSDISVWIIFGVPVGVVYGAIVYVAMSRVLNLQFDGRGWFIAMIISMVCGTLYVGIWSDYPSNLWNEWKEVLESATFSDSPMFFAYILWYAATAAVFDLGRQQPQSPVTKYDVGLLGGLVLTTYMLWRGL